MLRGGAACALQQASAHLASTPRHQELLLVVAGHCQQSFTLRQADC